MLTRPDGYRGIPHHWQIYNPCLVWCLTSSLSTGTDEGCRLLNSREHWLHSWAEIERAWTRQKSILSSLGFSTRVTLTGRFWLNWQCRGFDRNLKVLKYLTLIGCWHACRVLATAQSTRALLDLEARLEVTASHPGEEYIQYIVTFIWFGHQSQILKSSWRSLINRIFCQRTLNFALASLHRENVNPNPGCRLGARLS